MVLIGIGVMAFLRLRQVESADTPDQPGTDPVADVSDQDAVEIPGGSTEDSVAVPVTEGNSEASDVPVSGDTERDRTGTGTDAAINEIDTARGRRLMADMKDVATRVVGFASDSRGAVREAVSAGIVAELDRCRVPHRSGERKPLMDVQLELRQHDRQPTLWMSAELLAEEDGREVLVWKRSGMVTPLSNQALTSGLMPPNLNRDIGLFFRSLRSDFVDARREFGS